MASIPHLETPYNQQDAVTAAGSGGTQVWDDQPVWGVTPGVNATDRDVMDALTQPLTPEQFQELEMALYTMAPKSVPPGTTKKPKNKYMDNKVLRELHRYHKENQRLKKEMAVLRQDQQVEVPDVAPTPMTPPRSIPDEFHTPPSEGGGHVSPPGLSCAQTHVEVPTVAKPEPVPEPVVKPKAVRENFGYQAPPAKAALVVPPTEYALGDEVSVWTSYDELQDPGGKVRKDGHWTGLGRPGRQQFDASGCIWLQFEISWAVWAYAGGRDDPPGCLGMPEMTHQGVLACRIPEVTHRGARCRMPVKRAGQKWLSPPKGIAVRE